MKVRLALALAAILVAGTVGDGTDLGNPGRNFAGGHSVGNGAPVLAGITVIGNGAPVLSDVGGGPVLAGVIIIGNGVTSDGTGVGNPERTSEGFEHGNG
ncbi:MAG: hypothetical protein DHS20C21_01070 [Gemmatimonadota bacterium]|nr:MAG: hypothetical protein DHS20C21_01070 [Gemmatimonadota bacterium]